MPCANEFLSNLWSNFNGWIGPFFVKFVPGDMGNVDTKFGLLGDYIGGVWGTAIGLLTLVAVIFTYKSGRKIDYRTKTFAILAEMLRTHEEIVASLSIKGRHGRDAFSVILKEFYVAYGSTFAAERDDVNWSVDDRVDIAYTFVQYGLQEHTRRVLVGQGYDYEAIKIVADDVSRKSGKLDGRGAFGGHQNKIGHYFRNLFAAYEFIASARVAAKEKSSMKKIIRSKLSNYEQAVLAVNAISHLGAEWERSGLLKKFEPIKNIPRDFFSFDPGYFDMKKRFSYVNFEWEKSLKRVGSDFSFAGRTISWVKFRERTVGDSI